MTAASAGIAVTRFSTDAIVARLRHEAWSHRDWPAIGPLFETRPIGAFHNRSDRFALGPISIHVGEMAPQRYERTAAMARCDGFDQLMIALLLEGSTHGIDAGRSSSNSAGGMVFNDLTQPHAHESSASRTIAIAIPRVVATRAGLDPRALHGQSIAPPAAALVRSHLLAVHAALPMLTIAQGERLAQTLLDLLDVSVSMEGLREAPPLLMARDTALLAAARATIEAELTSRDLSVGWLCRHLGVSRSTLYRVFEGQGGVLALIRERRLEQVRRELQADASGRLADIAERWGFGDAAHMSRVFRAEFEMSPADYRAAARARR